MAEQGFARYYNYGAVDGKCPICDRDEKSSTKCEVWAHAQAWADGHINALDRNGMAMPPDPEHLFVYKQALIAALLEDTLGAVDPDQWACEESKHGLQEPYRMGPGGDRKVMGKDLVWD